MKKIMLFIFLGISLLLFSCNHKTENTIYEINKTKVVEIRCSNNDNNYTYGTGFTITEDGTILTNKHIILNSKNDLYSNIEVRYIDDVDFFSITFVDFSRTDDLAILKDNGNERAFFKLIDTDCYVGLKVYSIMNNGGMGLEFHTGIITSNNKIDGNENKKYCTVDFNINPGCSGSPVFDENNKLLGIITMRYYNNGEVMLDSSYFIPISSILESDIFSNNSFY